MRARVLVAAAVVCVLLGTLISVPAFVGKAIGAPGPGYGYGYHPTPPGSLHPAAKYALFSYETMFVGVKSTVSAGLVGGNGDVWVLTDAATEDVTAAGDVQIWNRASTGDITAGGTVGWFGKDASTGTIVEGADVDMLRLPNASANPDTANNIRGSNKAQPLDLQPGRYGMVFANGADPVILHGGEYDFMELSVGYGTHMTIDLTNGEPLVVRVKGRIHFVGNVQMEVIGGDASDIVFLADGSLVFLGQSGLYYGTFIAPNGRLEIGVRSQLVGAAWGRNVNAYYCSVVRSPYLHPIP